MGKNQWPEYPILMVDDDPAILKVQDELLRMEGITNIVCIDSGPKARDYILQNPIEIAVLDLTIPQLGGRELQEIISRERPDSPVIIVTASSDLKSALECMRRGSFDYMVKPVEPIRFVSSVLRGLEMKRIKREYLGLRDQLLGDEIENDAAFRKIMTKSEIFLRLLRYVESLAPSREAILIQGETGVGKDLLAKAIHEASRRGGAFVPVNIGGLDDTFFSDTLFGHRRGAFTGATENREGMIAKAAGGTLFLDEIGDLDMSSQVKLLRLLENREYQPLGSDLAQPSDARIILATHQNLKKLCDEGKFRKDLYYRISTYEVRVPALRTRPEDIPLLMDHFLELASIELEIPPVSCEKEVFSILSAYEFPGNIRELRSIAFRCAGFARSQKLSTINLNILQTLEPFADREDSPEAGTELFEFGSVLPSLHEVQDKLIEEALRRTKGNQTKAARMIGLSTQALNNRIVRGRVRSESP